MNHGHIEVIFGPMFSGKSSELQRRVKRHQIAKKNCLIVNFINDNRYTTEEYAATHDKNFMKCKKTNSLKSLDDSISQIDVIAIDEGQFFEDVVEYSDKWANEGKIVIVAALDATFQRKPFANVCQLLPIAETVKKLSSVCLDCGEKAAFSKRTVRSKEITLIGDVECYKAVCRKCFFIEKSDKLSNGSLSTDASPESLEESIKGKSDLSLAV